MFLKKEIRSGTKCGRMARNCLTWIAHHTGVEIYIYHMSNRIRRTFDTTVRQIQQQWGGDQEELPSYNSVRSMMYRTRGKNMPAMPHTPQDVWIMGQWTGANGAIQAGCPVSPLHHKIPLFGVPSDFVGEDSLQLHFWWDRGQETGCSISCPRSVSPILC